MRNERRRIRMDKQSREKDDEQRRKENRYLLKLTMRSNETFGSAKSSFESSDCFGLFCEFGESCESWKMKAFECIKLSAWLRLKGEGLHFRESIPESEFDPGAADKRLKNV